MKLISLNYLKSIIGFFLIILSPLSTAQENQDIKKIKVACVGNSITFGAGIEDRYKDSYPAILERMLGDGYEVGNFGNIGTTILMKGNDPYRNEKSFEEAISFNPDIVIIKLGTNDSKPRNWKYKDEFKKDYCDLIDIFKELPAKPKIFICLPVPAYKIKWGINDSIIKKEIIPSIEKISVEKNVFLIDLYKPLSDKIEVFPDSIHPNKMGAILIAKEVYKSITGKEGEFTDQLYPGKKSNWRGFDAYSFWFEGREAKIVAPKNIAPGKPWIWRAMFFDHEPQTDSALLERGYHVAFIEVTNLYGGPRAIKYWDHFYDYLTLVHGFSKKTVLEGLSRAGLVVFSWTTKNTEKVSSIYVDAPVCDIRSWPGPKHPMWKDCLKELSLSEKDVPDYKGNPIDILGPLAKASIPILSICGDSDGTVPYKDNTAVLAKRYQELGGQIQVILKPGIGHHPHSLKDPTPIVDFILQHQK
jgi:lysophospholipase L1-like esterase